MTYDQWKTTHPRDYEPEPEQETTELELVYDQLRAAQEREKAIMNDNLRHHLFYLAAGSEMASRHARALPFKPPFTTAARDELLDAKTALEAALQKVRAAMVEYDRKEIAL